MPRFDTAAESALDLEVKRPAFFAWLDIVGGPIRVTTFASSVTFSGTGDADLDGQTFSAIDPRVVEVGDAEHGEGGSGTLICRLSAIVTIDSETMNLLGDRSKWWMRTARFWVQLHDHDHQPIGAVAPYYTGYMMGLSLLPGAEEQVFELRCENYLALLAEASNRTYLSQSDFDPADTSATATIGAANNRSGPGAGLEGGGVSGGVPLPDEWWNPLVSHR